MSTTSGYSVVDVSHVTIFSNFGGTCISDNLRLGPSAGYGCLNYHDVDGNGGPDIGHLVKLIWKQGLLGEVAEVIVFQST